MALWELVEHDHGIPVLNYWMAACYFELQYLDRNHNWLNYFVGALAHSVSSSDNFEALEQWCYQFAVPEMVDVLFFCKLVDDMNDAIVTELVDPLDTVEDWFGDGDLEETL